MKPSGCDEEGRARRLPAWTFAVTIAVALAAAGCAGALARGPHGADVPTLQPFQVRTVQRELAVRGYAVEPTGVWDEATRTALAAYQGARGLPRTGVADGATLFRLGVDPDPFFNCETNNSVDCAPQGGP